MRKTVPVSEQYAKGVYYVGRYVWDKGKWALYSPGGVVLAIGTKTECEEELQRYDKTRET